MPKKISISFSLRHGRYDLGEDIGDYLPELETKFNKLASMQVTMIEKRQVAISLVSRSEEDSFASFMAALKIMEANRLTWDSLAQYSLRSSEIKCC